MRCAAWASIQHRAATRRVARRHRRHGSAAGDALAKVARSLLYYAVRNPDHAIRHAAMARIEKTVFISYRRTDELGALAVFENLTQHGYDVFIDYDGIASGNFATVI